jgi:hypothetical protein
MRVSNQGRLAARIVGVDANEPGLSQSTVSTHLPLTLEAGKHVDITMRWKAHKCLAVTHDAGAHFGIRAHSGLPVATEREYPVRTSYTFQSRLDPAPAAREADDEFTSDGNFGGWVMDALRFACEYGR